MERELKAVLFDLDGVITDSAEFHYLAWKELASHIGIAIDRNVNEQLKGVSRLESLERILAHGAKSDQYSEQEKLQLATQKNEHYTQLIKRITPHDILPGISDLLQELKDRGIRMAIASASNNAVPVLENLGLTSYFNAIADPTAVKKGKPDPAIFLLAAELVGVSPVHCIGIEDSQAGITAIKAAHMFAVGVGSSEVLSKADYLVSDTAQLTYRTLLQHFIIH